MGYYMGQSIWSPSNMSLKTLILTVLYDEFALNRVFPFHNYFFGQFLDLCLHCTFQLLDLYAPY